MIEFTDCLYIPMVGGYNPGDRVQLEPKLEAQLIASGKAKAVSEPASVVAHATKVEPGLTDD